MPDLAALPALIYRPGWTRLTMSGHVRRRRAAARPHGQDDQSELQGSLSVAPGGRYRADLADDSGERWLEICDGTSAWVVSEGTSTHERAVDNEIPFGDLLIPRWLLANYELEITGQSKYIGRSALVVVGHRHRPAVRRTGPAVVLPMSTR